MQYEVYMKDKYGWTNKKKYRYSDIEILDYIYKL